LTRVPPFNRQLRIPVGGRAVARKQRTKPTPKAKKTHFGFDKKIGVFWFLEEKSRDRARWEKASFGSGDALREGSVGGQDTKAKSGEKTRRRFPCGQKSGSGSPAETRSQLPRKRTSLNRNNCR